jgi:hypothetical protein
MHRYREFGVVSEVDEQLRRAFRDGFKGAGLSFAQFLDALGWYRDHARSVADEVRLTDAFARFAADRNWTAEHRDGVVALYQKIRDEGAAVMVETPSREQDHAVLARADELLRTDPARYWGDGELQDAAFEARERFGDVTAARGAEHADSRSSQDRQRVAEIEGLLRDPTGEGQRRYWSDAGLRAHYGEALARLQSGLDAAGGAASDTRTDTTTESGRDHSLHSSGSASGAVSAE